MKDMNAKNVELRNKLPQCKLIYFLAIFLYFLKLYFKLNIQTISRYHLRLELNDETGKIKTSVFDKEAEKIIKKPIYEMIMLQNSDLDSLLTVFDKLVGYEATFEMTITDYNRERHDSYFRISKVSPPNVNVLQEDSTIVKVTLLLTNDSISI